MMTEEKPRGFGVGDMVVLERNMHCWVINAEDSTNFIATPYLIKTMKRKRDVLFIASTNVTLCVPKEML